MAIETIDLLPAAPDPAVDTPQDFSQKAAAMVLAQKNMAPQLNAFATQANALAADVTANSITASSAAQTATSAAADAVALVGVSVWVSGTTYAKSVAVISQVNMQTYRRRVAGAGTTDPANDPTNWAILTGDGAFTPQPIPAGSINLALGNYHSKTINGNQAFTLDNCPSVGFSVVVRLTVTSGIVSLPTSVVTPDSVPYTLTAGRRHLLLLVTENNGAGWMMAAATNYPV